MYYKNWKTEICDTIVECYANVLEHDYANESLLHCLDWGYRQMM